MKEKKKIPLIIDCDPGVDDTLALFLAKNLDCFKIQAITTVSGNLSIEVTTENVQLVAGYLGLSCVVAKGAKEPLMKEKVTAAHIHGEDGLGGARKYFPKEKALPLAEEGALLVMRRLLLEAKEKVSILALGPLTNIALLLKAFPEVKEHIGLISIMGGGLFGGNVTPLSEFNFYVDPEAAQIVLQSGVPLLLSGIHMTEKAFLKSEDLQRVQESTGPYAKIGNALLKDFAQGQKAIHDPCAVLALARPDLFTWQEMALTVDPREGVSQGMLVPMREKNPTCKVMMDLQVDTFRELLTEAMMGNASSEVL